jgi:hypothetical protein
MSGAMALQPLCLSGVCRDNFLGGVVAEVGREKGMKENESERYMLVFGAIRRGRD